MWGWLLKEDGGVAVTRPRTSRSRARTRTRAPRASSSTSSSTWPVETFFVLTLHSAFCLPTPTRGLRSHWRPPRGSHCRARSTQHHPCRAPQLNTGSAAGRRRLQQPDVHILRGRCVCPPPCVPSFLTSDRQCVRISYPHRVVASTQTHGNILIRSWAVTGPTPRES